MTTPIAILALTAALFALMGVGSFVAPQKVTVQFGIPTLDRDGRNEVRAVYGGFGLAMAAVLGLAIAEPGLKAGIALAVGLALGGMAFGRVVSAGLDRGISKLPAFYLGLEAVGASLLLWVAVR